jgi:hypothetical protein
MARREQKSVGSTPIAMPNRFQSDLFLSVPVRVTGNSRVSHLIRPAESRFARVFLAWLCVAVSVSASTDRIVTAVYSGTYNGYKRPRAADGTFEREYYALANGSYLPGAGADASIDKVKFPQIAGLTAQLLAMRNYHLAPDSKQARFLLLITWGKTIPFNDGVYRANVDSFFDSANLYNRLRGFTGQATPGVPTGGAGAPMARGGDGLPSTANMVLQAAMDEFISQTVQMKMFNDMRRKADERNAQVLGYVDEINQREGPARFAGGGSAFDDLIDDIENERYFFVISAYDFPTAVKTGERKLLWATRVSVQAQGNKFNETAAYMLAKASKYFGQDSGRLIRQYDREGKVTLGDLKFVGVVPNPRNSSSPEEKK